MSQPRMAGESTNGSGSARSGWMKVVLLIAAYLVVLAAQAFVTRQVFTTRFPGANDFYPRWAGGCRLIWEGADPYSEDTTQAIQRGMYGRLAREGEDQVAFAYPLYVLAFTWPTCFFRDFATVQAAWMTISMHLILGGTALMKRVSGWGAEGGVWLATLGWSIFVYPNARAILLGQPSILVFLLMGISLWALRMGRPWIAGASLAGTTIKPQMSLLFVPWLLLWSFGRGRKRVILAFATTLAGLLLLSWLLQPDWVQGFIGQLRQYPSYTELASGIWIMTTYYLGSPRIVEFLLTGGGLLLLGWLWFVHRESGYRRMLWVASLTMLVTHFVSPRTATTHFAPFILPMFLIFESWREQAPARASLWSGLTLALVLVGSWALFLLTVQGDRESAINYLPIPLLLLGGLLWRRSEILRGEGRSA